MNNNWLILLITLGSICFSNCSLLITDESEEKDILSKLSNIDGIEVTELNSNNPDERVFQIDIIQPVDHNNLAGPMFTQRLYLHHINEDNPVVFAPDGYETNENELLGGELKTMFDANFITSTHRYWPGSEPEPLDFTYLTIWQAANDHHTIVSKLKEIYKGTWVSTGISKGAMTTLYHKRYFPDDVEAVVSISAPFKFGIGDQRYPEYLKTIGNEFSRNKVYNFQRMALERRDTLIPLFEAWFDQNGFTLYHDPNESFESIVIDFQLEFWEKNELYQFDQIPGNNATDQEILNLLHQYDNFIGYSELGLSIGAPFFYQAYTETGLEANSTEHLEDLLETDQIDLYPLFQSVLGINPVFDPSITTDIYNWIVNEGNNIIFLYGENDPWTAGAVELTGATNAIKIVNPEDNHSVFINDLSVSDQSTITNALENWLNEEIL